MSTVLVLAEGHYGTTPVFIVDWDDNKGSTNCTFATIVFREAGVDEYRRPIAAGAIRRVCAWDEYHGDYLTVDAR